MALQIAASLRIVAEPFLPDTAKKLSAMLQVAPDTWKAAGDPDYLVAGHQLGEAALLFQKVEDETVEAQVLKLLNTKLANQLENAVVEPAKENITFEDFSKIDIRIGTILEAEKVAKTKKLLKLKIDTGIDQRTIVSGIAEYFDPAAIIGQQVSVLVNLAPREIKGIQSQGMILMAENADGSLAFVQPSVALKNGSGVS